MATTTATKTTTPATPPAASPGRPYDPSRDLEAARRCWRECGWLKNDEENLALDHYLAGSRSLVADLDGTPECLVMAMPADLRHGERDLSMCAIIAVTTSIVGRKQGFAAQVTAQSIAEHAAEGVLTSGLGMFEQGFYNQLGFGTGNYIHRYGLVPTDLKVPGATRPPRRLTIEDFEAIHAARRGRRREHGSSDLFPVEFTRARLFETKATGGMGFGYHDGPGGGLSHFLWFNPRSKVEEGPWYVSCMAWRTRAEYLELLGVIRNLGDQIPLVWVFEHNGLQLQDLMRKPFRHIYSRKGGDYDSSTFAAAWWQRRMNDVPACLAATTLPTSDSVRFNLVCTDPIERHLAGDAPWRGCSGTYVVTLGRECHAERRETPDAGLPTLTTTINCFTRLWLGVGSASALSITDDLVASDESLIEGLDRVLLLPAPDADWDF